MDLYPDKDKYKKPLVSIANENDDEEDDEQPEIIDWTFKTYMEEQENNLSGHYHKLNAQGIDDDFLKNTTLGFAYLVPANISDSTAQQKFYSSVFRNINMQGEPLMPQESRKSLYFLNNNLEQFFDPNFFKHLTINNRSSVSKLDFIRYLSLLSQYYKENRANNIAKYFSGKGRMETYYEEYIYSIVGENDSNMFADFSVVFPDGTYNTRFELLQKTITELDIPKQLTSYIDWDIYLFGLIYETVFENKSIDDTRKENLKGELSNKIRIFKADTSHAKTPSALKHLRSRIDESITIYKKYTK